MVIRGAATSAWERADVPAPLSGKERRPLTHGASESGNPAAQPEPEVDVAAASGDSYRSGSVGCCMRLVGDAGFAQGGRRLTHP
ncbi:hypothetical protein [Flindersiella endophytica]